MAAERQSVALGDSHAEVREEACRRSEAAADAGYMQWSPSDDAPQQESPPS